MKYTPAAAGPVWSRLCRARLVGAVATAILLVAGCGGHSSFAHATGAPSSSAGATIEIKNFGFQPATLAVAPGAKVTVHNEDSATHTVTAVDKAFDTGNVSGGSTATFTAPSKPGSYPYICTIHQFMRGTLTVK